MRGVVVRQLAKLAGFAGRATKDVVNRNPALSPYRDGYVKALQPPSPAERGATTVRVNMAVRQKQTVSK